MNEILMRFVLTISPVLVAVIFANREEAQFLQHID
jgi:hypothetical protein